MGRTKKVLQIWVIFIPMTPILSAHTIGRYETYKAPSPVALADSHNPILSSNAGNNDRRLCLASMAFLGIERSVLACAILLDQ
jgi:hypothetical protein